jgi:hypothetical protein
MPPRTITILRKLPSQNETLYRHWKAYTTERDAWFVLLRAQLAPCKPVDYPVRMAIRSYRTRLIDYANLVGGSKPIPDCLIRLGYLKDDSPRWFECTYEQFLAPKSSQRTEIEFR